ncbi:RNA 2',3'-cyclic phosphodiesterase [Sulfurimonas sp. HSL3-7]|uniref:RNA 2',3'-cyclic phosphodiesterase n=1 Tax=Sulfonitrofixus jiaomeiensis TaxID=3131938 RepID=UPI0031FA1A81
MKNRLFLALPAILDDYEAIQNDFAEALEGRWVPPANLHLTLSFFGRVDDPEALEEKLSSLKMTLTPSIIGGMGCFVRKKILFATVENPSLEALYEEVNTFFELPVRRPFVGHVTLMRFKRIVDEAKFDEALEGYRDCRIGVLGAHPLLMQSTLQPEGAKYSEIRRY